jgi:hypothetical protein
MIHADLFSQGLAVNASLRIVCTDAGSETGSSAPRRMFKDEHSWDATTVTRHSGHNELWIDADWLLGQRMTPRSSHRRSWGLLAAAVILFCIGPAMRGAKKPSLRADSKAALQKLPSANQGLPSRQTNAGGVQENQMGSVKASAITSIAELDSALNVTIADESQDRERSITPDFFIPSVQDFLTLPYDANHNLCVEEWGDLYSMGPSEPTWSPTAFWNACRTTWDESPWGLRPDAWIVPAVSMSEGTQ